MTNYTHQIIRMERGATKGSGSPMWRCRTADGQPVNVFQHSDPAKNNARLFIDAGYFGFMEGLRIGEAVEWSEHPIDVVMVSDGKWFEVTAVAPRPEAAEPDAMWMPDLKAYRLRANRTALNIVNHAVRIFDVEATGLRTSYMQGYRKDYPEREAKTMKRYRLKRSLRRAEVYP